MTIQSPLPLVEFVEWIEDTDEHASTHVRLLQDAANLLADTTPASADQRRSLADRLERWRYSLLNRGLHSSADRDRELADALDLAANELAQGSPRPPRAPRSALDTESGQWAWGDEFEGLDLAELEASLHPEADLAPLIQEATALTLRHFSSVQAPTLSHAKAAAKRRMVLYAPLYLSNHCVNHCLYCGFRYPNELQRDHLDQAEAIAQARILGERGFRHLLLVAGDFPQLTSTEYYTGIIRELRDQGFSVAVEIAPLSTAAYAEVVRAGATGLTLYQETYDEELYRHYHPRGSKALFDWRLEGLERGAESGMERLGLGVLLGLRDPAEDLLAVIRHGRYLRERFAGIDLAFSLPRIHEAPGGFVPPCRVDDETFVRLYCVLRLAFPCANLILSTREAGGLRDRLADICITQMSAGSSTAPGGYREQQMDEPERQQFPVVDHRGPAEVAQRLSEAGFEVCWDV